ncbi:MAG: DUF305 domain-containing protein [Solirubrobacterales bacterium]|nr:DUF305 domain-containing protein [Solirubrobacterales bacterium]
MRISKYTMLRALVLVALLVATTVLAACGGDDGENESMAGNGTDLAFIEGMIPHHRDAVDMAKVAQDRAQSRFVKDLAQDIIKTQNAEIAVMERIKDDLSGVKAQDLGVSEHDMGMDNDLKSLKSADPFDREFIDMMIPHHQGAIRMAHVELSKGGSEALKNIAKDVVAAQSREIKAMNEHRKAEYGAPSPAGGVPEDMPGGEDMSDHGM